jgi:hypothetical protein
MAVTRNSLKNKFINVRNNFRSNLSSAIGVNNTQIPLLDTPSKLGSFGYVTVDNVSSGG